MEQNKATAADWVFVGSLAVIATAFAGWTINKIVKDVKLSKKKKSNLNDSIKVKTSKPRAKATKKDK